MKFNFKILMVLALLVMLFTTTFLWLKGVATDFTANLTTEILGIIITVLIVDVLLKKNEEEKKRKVSHIALIQCLKAADRILTLFYPKDYGTGITIKYTFGSHEIITINNSFTNGTEFILSIKDKGLFAKRIESEVKDPTFVDYASTRTYLFEKNEKLLELGYMFNHAMAALQYSDDSELYSLALDMHLAMMQYYDMKEMNAGHKTIADLIAEFEIPMVNAAIKVRSAIINQADKTEELLNFNTIRAALKKKKVN